MADGAVCSGKDGEIQLSGFDNVILAIGSKAYNTTPKPGLVDLHDNGAHRDMNPELFRRSVRTITPYLSLIMKEGYIFNGSDQQLFRKIRRIGIMAEKEMFAVTKNVNTHKGAIFIFGILCASFGKSFRDNTRTNISYVLKKGQMMSEWDLQEELSFIYSHKPISNGDKILHQYGERGIRGEVIDGFPTLQKAFKFFQAETLTFKEDNFGRLNTLLYIMSKLNDTNVINRGGIDALIWIQRVAAEILEHGGSRSDVGYHMIEELNRECIQKNISPGGGADILSAVVLLRRFEEILEHLNTRKVKNNELPY